MTKPSIPQVRKVTVGQRVLISRMYHHDDGLHWATVTKVGRTWVSVDHHRVRLQELLRVGLAQDGDYVIYRNATTYNEHQWKRQVLSQCARRLSELRPAEMSSAAVERLAETLDVSIKRTCKEAPPDPQDGV